jgi:hypothetical protein
MENYYIIMHNARVLYPYISLQKTHYGNLISYSAFC